MQQEENKPEKVNIDQQQEIDLNLSVYDDSDEDQDVHIIKRHKSQRKPRHLDAGKVNQSVKQMVSSCPGIRDDQIIHQLSQQFVLSSTRDLAVVHQVIFAVRNRMSNLPKLKPFLKREIVKKKLANESEASLQQKRERREALKRKRQEKKMARKSHSKKVRVEEKSCTIETQIFNLYKTS